MPFLKQFAIKEIKSQKSEVESILDRYNLNYKPSSEKIMIDFHQLYKLKAPELTQLEKELKETGCKITKLPAMGWAIFIKQFAEQKLEQLLHYKCKSCEHTFHADKAEKCPKCGSTDITTIPMIMETRPYTSQKKHIRIVVEVAGGQGNTNAFFRGDEVEVIRFEEDGSAVVWAQSLSGKRRVTLLPYQFEVI